MQTKAKDTQVKVVAHAVQLAVEDYTASHNGEQPLSIRDIESSLPETTRQIKNPYNQNQTYTIGSGLVDGERREPGQVGYIAPQEPGTPYKVVGKLKAEDYRLTGEATSPPRRSPRGNNLSFLSLPAPFESGAVFYQKLLDFFLQRPYNNYCLFPYSRRCEMTRYVSVLSCFVILAFSLPAFAVWPPAIRLTDGPNDNIKPEAYVQEQPTPGGPLVLVWQRSRPAGWDIYSRENRYGMSWLSSVIVSSLPDSNLTPTIVAYYNYRYCAWVNCHGDSQNILCSRWNRTDSTWSPAMYVTQDTFPDLEPSVWCSEYRDSAAVAWVSLRNGRWNLYTRFYNGSSWSPVIPVVTDSGNNRCPRFFRVNFGYTYLAWQNDVRGNWDIYTSRYSGGSWSAPKRITNGSQADVQPSPVKGVGGGQDEVNLLWASDSLSNWEIFGTNCESALPPSPERFTSHDSSDSEPSALMYWLPSVGKALYHPLLTAWTSRRDGNANIYAEYMNLTEVVDTNRAEDCHPTVSTTPGNKDKGNWIYNWVIWQSNRDGNWNLYGSYKTDWNGGVELGDTSGMAISEAKAIRPSPFRPPGSLTIHLSSPHAELSFRLYDLQGRCVGSRKAESKAFGRYELSWDGKNQEGHALPSGLYFLKPEGTSALFRIVLLR